MTDRPKSGQQERKKNTSLLGRAQLEQAFQKALDSGPDAIPQQIRYVLALSQMNAVRSSTEPHPETPATIAEARLAALVDVAYMLDQGQRNVLFKDLQQIPDDDIRLPLTIQLIQYAKDHPKEIIKKIWEQACKLINPLVRSQTLFLLTSLIHEDLSQLSSSEAPPDARAMTTTLTEAINLAQLINNAEARVRSLISLSPYLPQTLRIRLINYLLDYVNGAKNDTLKANTINTLADHLTIEVEENAFNTARSIQAAAERVRAMTALARSVSPTLQLRVGKETLKGIEAIDNEEESAAALAAFAPYLESAREDAKFPELLEQALVIAISLTRRHLRAKTLVALAPHLTPDLQGEALAAVHSLSSERERAILLAELAPTLPGDMLVASLAVAHTMREQDARVHALTVLARFAPQHARNQTLLDALAAAVNLPHHYERVTALASLVDILPPHLQDQAFTNALETTRLIENEHARARAFSLLGNSLPPMLFHRALESAYQIQDAQQRLNALTGMMQRVPKEEQKDALRHMLVCVAQIPFEYKQARALVSVAPHLTPDMIADAIVMVDGFQEPFDRVNAYIALAQNLPRAARPQVIDKAWGIIHEIDDGYDRSSALVAIAPFLPDGGGNNLAQMAVSVIKSIEDEYDRASAMSILAPLLAQGKHTPPPVLEPSLDKITVLQAGLEAALEIPQQSLRAQQMAMAVPIWLEMTQVLQYEVWKGTAAHLCSLPLPDVLMCLGALMRVFESLIGQERLKEIAQVLGVR